MNNATTLAELPAEFEQDGHRYETRGDRVVRDGTDTGVLVSPGYGAGFTTWNSISPFQPLAVMAVLLKRKDLIQNATEEELETMGDRDAYLGGADDLTVEWLPFHTRFRIEEYDGSEYLRTLEDLIYIA